jgi:hypothetical protein
MTTAALKPFISMPEGFNFEPKNAAEIEGKRILHEAYKCFFGTGDKNYHRHYMHRLTNGYQNPVFESNLIRNHEYAPLNGILQCFDGILHNPNEDIDIRNEAFTHMLYLFHDDKYEWLKRDKPYDTAFESMKKLLLAPEEEAPTELKLKVLDHAPHFVYLSRNILDNSKQAFVRPALDLYAKMADDTSLDISVREKALEQLCHTIAWRDITPYEWWVQDRSNIDMAIAKVEEKKKDPLLGQKAQEMADYFSTQDNMVMYLSKDFIKDSSIFKPATVNDISKERNTSEADAIEKVNTKKLATIRKWAVNTKDLTGREELKATVKQKYDTLHVETSDITVEKKSWNQLDFYSRAYKALTYKNR